MRPSQRISNIEARKRQPTKEDDDGKTSEKAKKPAIKIHGDIILKFLGWIPLTSLLNILLSNRRFWFFGNESLDERKRTIYHMQIRGSCTEKDELWLQMDKHGGCIPIEIPEAEPPKKFRLEFLKIDTYHGCGGGEWIPIEIPEAEPPEKFRLEFLKIDTFPGYLDKETKEFLRFSKDLFVGTEAQFDSSYNVVDMDEFDVISTVIDQFKDITIGLEGFCSTNRFFSSETVLNCSRLSVSINGIDNDLSDDSIINWLHHPLPEWDPTATQRQIWFDNVRHYDGNGLPKLFDSLKQKFKEDTTKHKFILVFSLSDDWPEMDKIENTLGWPEMDKIENTATDEVLFTRVSPAFYKFIRCPKEEENTCKCKWEVTP